MVMTANISKLRQPLTKDAEEAVGVDHFWADVNGCHLFRSL
jgi:hypothetical protein